MSSISPIKCFVCDRIGTIKKGQNKYFVKEMLSGYVVLGDFQYFHGYTLFISKVHTDELYKLDKREQENFLKEMALVAEAVIKAFKPKKLNYELLGNTDSHLHWHLIPRYGTDPRPETGIWAIDFKIRCNKDTRPTEYQLTQMRKKLLLELNQLLK
ncbi:HIT family protein [Patescibacteria group bacterium]|nr:HIT family protein [Patescibacteria group bacterium]